MNNNIESEEWLLSFGIFWCFHQMEAVLEMRFLDGWNVKQSIKLINALGSFVNTYLQRLLSETAKLFTSGQTNYWVEQGHCSGEEGLAESSHQSKKHHFMHTFHLDWLELQNCLVFSSILPGPECLAFSSLNSLSSMFWHFWQCLAISNIFYQI